jgi:hypothetical protein
MPFVWEQSPEDAFGALFDTYIEGVHQAVKLLCIARQPEIEAWMKSNASWTDRTGNARQGLNVTVEDLSDAIIIRLSHGVDYGWYLETRFAGAYSIIAPAVDYWFARIMNDVNGLVGNVGYGVG